MLKSVLTAFRVSGRCAAEVQRDNGSTTFPTVTYGASKRKEVKRN